MKYLILAALVGGSGLSMAAEPAYSDATVNAVNDFREAMVEAEQDFADAKAKAVERLTKDLEREVERATRRGDLDGALAIRALLKEVTGQESQAQGGTDLLKAIPGREEKPKRGGDPRFFADSPKFTMGSYYIQLMSDGTVVANWDAFKNGGGTYERTDGDNVKVIRPNGTFVPATVNEDESILVSSGRDVYHRVK